MQTHRRRRTEAVRSAVETRRGGKAAPGSRRGERRPPGTNAFSLFRDRLRLSSFRRGFEHDRGVWKKKSLSGGACTRCRSPFDPGGKSDGSASSVAFDRFPVPSLSDGRPIRDSPTVKMDEVVVPRDPASTSSYGAVRRMRSTTRKAPVPTVFFFRMRTLFRPFAERHTRPVLGHDGIPGGTPRAKPRVNHTRDRFKDLAFSTGARVVNKGRKASFWPSLPPSYLRLFATTDARCVTR